MDRKIIFRGKAILTDDWVYGAYLRFLDADGVLRDGIAEEDCDNTAHLLSEIWAIDPTTLGEYTGLDDYNGKMIFEGDIVEGNDFTEEDGYGLVQWNEGAWEVCGMELNTIAGCFYEHFFPAEFIVVGNEHDNPDLLWPSQYDEIDEAAERCYECGGYGDDYSYDDNSELVPNCDTFPFNTMNKELE